MREDLNKGRANKGASEPVLTETYDINEVPDGHHPRGTTLLEALQGNELLGWILPSETATAFLSSSNNIRINVKRASCHWGESLVSL